MAGGTRAYLDLRLGNSVSTYPEMGFSTYQEVKTDIILQSFYWSRLSTKLTTAISRHQKSNIVIPCAYFFQNRSFFPLEIFTIPNAVSNVNHFKLECNGSKTERIHPKGERGVGKIQDGERQGTGRGHRTNCVKKVLEAAKDVEWEAAGGEKRGGSPENKV